MTKGLIPFIVVFGVYVISHGELSPGGGFQGGVIIAAAYIVYALVFGRARAQEIVPRRASDVLSAVGVLIYAGVGVVGLLGGLWLGGEPTTFLDYGVLDPEHPAHGQTLGMTLVELGVGLTVATVMITVFQEIVEE